MDRDWLIVGNLLTSLADLYREDEASFDELVRQCRDSNPGSSFSMDAASALRSHQLLDSNGHVRENVQKIVRSALGK